MIRRLVIATLTIGCILTGVRFSWAQGGFDMGGFGSSGAGGGGTDVGGAANLGGALNPGAMGGGESMPGAILVKITGEVQCVACTLEEMGLEETPGDMYQFSRENTHMVIKITKAVPDMAWEMVERHKLFLAPGEDAAQLQRLISEGKAGKRVELTGGVAPEADIFVPISVKVK